MNEMFVQSRVRPWTVRSSALIHSDRWIKLRADSCEAESGTVIEPYYVLEYPDWVNVVVEDEHKRLLVRRQYRHGIGAVSLELPCGGVEPSDGSPLVAASRELLEETGLAAGVWSQLCVLSPNPASHSNRVYSFLARDLKIVGNPNAGAGELGDCEFIEWSQLCEQIESGAFRQAMHVAALFAYTREIARR